MALRPAEPAPLPAMTPSSTTFHPVTAPGGGQPLPSMPEYRWRGVQWQTPDAPTTPRGLNSSYRLCRFLVWRATHGEPNSHPHSQPIWLTFPLLAWSTHTPVCLDRMVGWIPPLGCCMKKPAAIATVYYMVSARTRRHQWCYITGVFLVIIYKFTV